MPTALAPALFDQVEDALKEVMDPELGINIVDLGLIYDLSWDEENDALIISMTLTSAGWKCSPDAPPSVAPDVRRCYLGRVAR